MRFIRVIEGILITGLVLIALLGSFVSCGGGTSSSSNNDSEEETNEVNNSSQTSECLTLAAELTDTYFVRSPVEDMDKITGWEGYVYHHTHVHNEGVGKWYLYPSESIEVRAPIDGRICSSIEDGDEGTVNGNEVIEDSGLELYFGDDIKIQYGHIYVLASLKDEYDAAGDEGIAISEGDLLGYTSDGNSALDFQIYDENETNDMPEEAPHVKHWVCPMNHYEAGTSLRTELLDKWDLETYQPALDEKDEQVAEGARANPGNSELAEDTCSAVNVNTMNYGTIWGNWYNEQGESSDSSIGSWFHYIRGTITLLPNSMLNEDTYTVGYGGEDGVWSEMRSNAGVGDPWVSTDQMSPMWLADGVSASDTAGCFILSKYAIDHEEAIWVYFELTEVDGGDDLLDLTTTSADNLNDCMTEGETSGPAESFSRYP